MKRTDKPSKDTNSTQKAMYKEEFDNVRQEHFSWLIGTLDKSIIKLISDIVDESLRNKKIINNAKNGEWYRIEFNVTLERKEPNNLSRKKKEPLTMYIIHKKDIHIH